MTTQDRIKRSIAQRKDDVFVRQEFEQFGSQSQVSRALKQLVSEGRLVKLGIGIYAKAKPSVLSGKPIPVRPVDVLAPDALKKLGVVVGPSRLTEDYNTGKSTQIPAGTVFCVGQRRISRKIGFGGRYIKFEWQNRSIQGAIAAEGLVIYERPTPKPTILALDLEGTLISNAVSQIPRPGLHDFLIQCAARFPRIVMFTTVPEDRFRAIAHLLVEENEAPACFAGLEYIHWTGRTKDLGCIPNAAVDDVFLLDDCAEYVHPGQEKNWIPIGCFDPANAGDTELLEVLPGLLSGTLKHGESRFDR